jgi:two-component system, OmpR family, response regulator VicR
VEIDKPKILLAEDDENLAYVMRDYFNLLGYKTLMCHDGKAAWDTFNTENVNLCLLDVMLPGMDGFTLGEKIRGKDQSVPIIYLTAKSMKEDKMLGFRLGADDYVTKPFDIEELSMRIAVFLKRKEKANQNISQIQLGSMIFDYTNMQLKTEEVTINLTQREADVLYMLCQNKNTIVKRDELLLKIWGSDDYFLGRSLDVYISKIRKFLKNNSSVYIQNVHSVGFKLRCD